MVAGARPNFMKIAPILRAIMNFNNTASHFKIKKRLIHTGQHYDFSMSGVFFKDLNLERPDIYIGVGSGSHGEQTGRIMIEFEKICIREKPDLVLVVGDVNSTLACSIIAAKLCIPIAHVEAGLRSFDRSMPEEINRIVTDCLSDFLFTTCQGADENLRREGVPKEKIFFVGNVMADTLLKFKADIESQVKVNITEKDYALLTLHRPSNVDNREIFRNILKALQKVSQRIPIIFPVHPRTKKQIKSFGYVRYFNLLKSDISSLKELKSSINLLDPLSYLEFLYLMSHAKFVLTDSGGIQEETTILGTPCLTIRENTERPITIEEGTNVLVGTDPAKIIRESFNILSGKGKAGRVPKFWDGEASERIVKILSKKLLLKDKRTGP